MMFCAAPRPPCELAIKLRDHLANSFGCSGRGGNDVLRGTTASPPVLATRSINGLLGSGGGVDSGHQALEDAVVVVDNLSKRSQAVATRSINGLLGSGGG